MFTTLAKGYSALAHNSATNNPSKTIDVLCEKLKNGESLSDRKAAMMALKGMSRDWSEEIGERALPSILAALERDAALDADMGKIIVETLAILCEVSGDADDCGLRNTDAVLRTAAPVHVILALLQQTHFYLRFFSLQLIGILLGNRPEQVQTHVLSAAGGLAYIVDSLGDTRDIIRNEALLLLISLATSNADIQKLLVFEGAFDRLFAIIRNEGGVTSPSITVQDCLAAIAGLLRWNVSNVVFFRETGFIPSLAALLHFPTQPTPTALRHFSTQRYTEQRAINTGLVMSIIRMLVSSSDPQSKRALLQANVPRCLVQLGLGSTAPRIIRSQALNALADIVRGSPENQTAVASYSVRPVAGGGDPEPQLLDEQPALCVLVATAIESARERNDPAELDESAPSGTGPAGSSSEFPDDVSMTGSRARSRGRSGTNDASVAPHAPPLPLVQCAAVNAFQAYISANRLAQDRILSNLAGPQFGKILEADEEQYSTVALSLVRHLRSLPAADDAHACLFACLMFATLINSDLNKELGSTIYFNGGDLAPGGELDGDPDDRESLISVLVGNMMMAQRAALQSANEGGVPEPWNRILVGYLVVLNTWLFESPRCVREFLTEGSNLNVIIAPVSQPSGDALVQGLCVFLLGICYAYNTQPGAITRATLHPILRTRVGPDQFTNKILRLREDPRFRSVGPDIFELDGDEESNDLWFDYTFVEFIKTHYVSVQQAILTSPDAVSDEHNKSSLIAGLEATITQHEKQLESLGSENEDLLVLLEELSMKRSRDKQRMRDAGLEVSEDEFEEDGAEGEEDAAEQQYPNEYANQVEAQPAVQHEIDHYEGQYANQPEAQYDSGYSIPYTNQLDAQYAAFEEQTRESHEPNDTFEIPQNSQNAYSENAPDREADQHPPSAHQSHLLHSETYPSHTNLAVSNCRSSEPDTAPPNAHAGQEMYTSPYGQTDYSGYPQETYGQTEAYAQLQTFPQTDANTNGIYEQEAGYDQKGHYSHEGHYFQDEHNHQNDVPYQNDTYQANGVYSHDASFNPNKAQADEQVYQQGSNYSQPTDHNLPITYNYNGLVAAVKNDVSNVQNTSPHVPYNSQGGAQHAQTSESEQSNAAQCSSSVLKSDKYTPNIAYYQEKIDAIKRAKTQQQQQTYDKRNIL